jgi:hypothetical protein
MNNLFFKFPHEIFKFNEVFEVHVLKLAFSQWQIFTSLQKLFSKKKIKNFLFLKKNKPQKNKKRVHKSSYYHISNIAKSGYHVFMDYHHLSNITNTSTDQVNFTVFFLL